MKNNNESDQPQRIADRIKQLDLVLPDAAPAPLASYVPAVASEQTVQTSGQLPMVAGSLVASGKVGTDGIAIEDAQAAARQSTLNALAAIRDVIGSLDRIDQILKVTVFVASMPEFTEQPTVANGASELLGAVFGDTGTHVRSAVGVASLPKDAPVEIEITARYH